MKNKWISGLVGFLCLWPMGGKAATADRMEIAPSAEAVRPLGAGDRVPDGTLTTIDGKKVNLQSLIAQKPSVLIFYRGGWCPFCNLQMGQLVKVEPELKKMGYQILAISPDRPEKLRESLDKHGINYTLLSDSRLEVTRKFGLAYHVSPEILAKMKGFGVDLEAATGNNLHLLPVPAAYVADTRGVLHFVYFNPDIKVRVDPEALLKAAREAQP